MTNFFGLKLDVKYALNSTTAAVTFHIALKQHPERPSVLLTAILTVLHQHQTSNAWAKAFIQIQRTARDITTAMKMRMEILLLINTSATTTMSSTRVHQEEITAV